METANNEQFVYGNYTIAKDFNKHTVLITRPSPRARLGIKVVHHFSFRGTDPANSNIRMNSFVDKFIQEQEAIAQSKLNRKSILDDARRNFKNPFSVGDILYKSWGYEQTNVDFYQITETKKKTITVRALQQNRTDTGFMSGTTIALKDHFASDEQITKRIQIRVWNEKEPPHIDVCDLSRWDGTPLHWSSYH